MFEMLKKSPFWEVLKYHVKMLSENKKLIEQLCVKLSFKKKLGRMNQNSPKQDYIGW